MIYDLIREPTGDLYHRLLDYALPHCSSFLLVPWRRHNNDPSTSTMRVLSDLDPFLLSKERAAEWPGTQLIGHDAEIRWFEYNLASVQVLKSATTRLYQWEQPDFPEDLCLMRDRESPWLVTIAHERDAYLKLGIAEMEVIAAEFPELSSICGEPWLPDEAG